MPDRSYGSTPSVAEARIELETTPPSQRRRGPGLTRVVASVCGLVSMGALAYGAHVQHGRDTTAAELLSNLRSADSLPAARSHLDTTGDAAKNGDGKSKQGAGHEDHRRKRRGDSQAAGTENASFVRPNVVFLFVDDMGHNDIGYSSNDLGSLTPVMDELAGDGIKLTRYYSMHMCTPARTALYTAKYPMKLGMQYENIKPDQPWGLPHDEELMPKYFHNAGFRTHLIGKWNQGHFDAKYLPTARGFDSFTGYLSDEVNYITHLYPTPFQGSDDDAPEDYTDLSICTTRGGQLNPWTEANSTFSTELYTQRALEVIAEHDVDTGEYAGTAMFMLYTAQNVHGPLDTPPLHLLSSDTWDKINIIGQEGDHRRSFAALVALLDDSVGKIKGAMEDASLWDNTLFVMASDNGGCACQGGSNEPLRGGKHWLFEGGVRVPSFIYGPSVLPSHTSGSEYTALMHVTDWVPTLLTACEVPFPFDGDDGQWDGVSHWLSLSTVSDYPRQELLLQLQSWTTCCNATDEGEETCAGFLSDCYDESTALIAQLAEPRGAIIVNDMKLINNEYDMPWFAVAPGGNSTIATDATGNTMENCGDDPGGTPRNYLFNLTSDPLEQVNLYNDLPDVVSALNTRLRSYAEQEVQSHWQPSDTSAYSSWKANGYFIGSWISTESS